MTEGQEFTVRVEETASGAYRAHIESAPEGHFAEAEAPLVAARGALTVARETVDAAFDGEPSTDRGWAVSE